MSVHGEGPVPARIMFVGEAPASYEIAEGRPFVGPAGQELDRQLKDVGLARRDCFITNVCRERAPGDKLEVWLHRGDYPMRDKMVHLPVVQGLKHLHDEIARVQPNVIVAMGNTSLWALTGEWGIDKWRGSHMWSEEYDRKVVPTYHPSYIVNYGQWRKRPIVLHDLRTAISESHTDSLSTPPYEFELEPSFDRVRERLDYLARLTTPTRVSVDIENPAGPITCIGIAVSRLHAICIPMTEGYWSPVERHEVIAMLERALTNPNVHAVGQNFQYDSQIIYAELGFHPNCMDDTMVQISVAFPDGGVSLDEHKKEKTPQTNVTMRKALAFLSSMFCVHHRYWKDDRDSDDPRTQWNYNCIDCVTTYEIADKLDSVLQQFGLYEQYLFQMRRLWPAALAMSERGIKVDVEAWERAGQYLEEEGAIRAERLERLLPHDVWPRVYGTMKKGVRTKWHDSPTQLRELIYDTFGQKPIYKPKTKSPTTNDDALKRIGKREPVLKPLLDCLLEYRKCKTYLQSFLSTELERDGRLRCTFSISVTETLRLASSSNCFRRGTNLQNLPVDVEEEEVTEETT